MSCSKLLLWMSSTLTPLVADQALMSLMNASFCEPPKAYMTDTDSLAVSGTVDAVVAAGVPRQPVVVRASAAVTAAVLMRLSLRMLLLCCAPTQRPRNAPLRSNSIYLR